VAPTFVVPSLITPNALYASRRHLHDVVFAFQAQGAFGAGVGLGAGFEQLVPADGFGADEVVVRVGMADQALCLTQTLTV